MEAPSTHGPSGDLAQWPSLEEEEYARALEYEITEDEDPFGFATSSPGDLVDAAPVSSGSSKDGNPRAVDSAAATSTTSPPPVDQAGNASAQARAAGLSAPPASSNSMAWNITADPTLAAIADETEEDRKWKLLGKQRIAASMKANWLERKRDADALKIANEAKRLRCTAAKADIKARIQFWEDLNAESTQCLPSSHEHFWQNLDSGLAAAPAAPAYPGEGEDSLFDDAVNDPEGLPNDRPPDRLQRDVLLRPGNLPQAPSLIASNRLAAVRQRLLARQAASSNERPQPG